MLEFQADGEIINDLEVEFKRDERVIRWQTVRLEKFALEYSERRKKKLSTNTKEK
jgi:small subunit ribosomal protein S6